VAIIVGAQPRVLAAVPRGLRVGIEAFSLFAPRIEQFWRTKAIHRAASAEPSRQSDA
jgi:hypothetical protein